VSNNFRIHPALIPSKIKSPNLAILYAFRQQFPRVQRKYARFTHSKGSLSRRPYLWHAVDQDGHVLDILVQRWRDKNAAKQFFRKLLKGFT
jgi:transposase-like protein